HGSSFRGEPFSPMLVVEVDDINTQADLGLQAKLKQQCLSSSPCLGDLDGGDALPGFKLKVWKIEEAILQ
ncbi:9662_t:CDS:2, partial [Funneliformis mosseae]